MNFKYLLLLLSIFMLFSCGDGDGPTITINSPENGASFAPGSTVPLSVTITDDIGVTSVQVDSGDLGINTSDPVNDSPLTVNFTLDIMLLPETPPGRYDLTVTATDTDGNFSDEDLSIEVQ